jgi:uncharacterized peroxidase-related enzyme
MNVFEKIKKERGMVARIYSDFNEFPVSVKSHFELNKALMLNDGPLPREEREWLAVCVSDANKNKYCATHHKEALDKYKGKMNIDQVKLFLSMAKILTKTPEKFEPEKFRKLFHKWRYSEAQYQHAINIIGYFNYTNRLAFGMGITLEEGYEKSCN